MMTLLYRKDHPSAKSGFSAILLLFLIFLFLIGGLVIFDYGYIAYIEKQNVYPTPTPVPGKTYTPITAYGSFSKDKYSVDIVLHFFQEGGAVSGEFSGDCSGNITGDYDGKDGGVISGKAFGSCDPLFVPVPASAVFNGTVNQSQKIVPISGSGSALGFSGSGSLVLKY